MNKVGKLLTKMSIFANHASPYLEQQVTKIMMKYKIVIYIFDDITVCESTVLWP